MEEVKVVHEAVAGWSVLYIESGECTASEAYGHGDIAKYKATKRANQLIAQRSQDTDRMANLLLQSKEIDAEAYNIAYIQATKLSDYLVYRDECGTITISVGKRSFDLDIWHTDVLNELFVMLTNIAKLKED